MIWSGNGGREEPTYQSKPEDGTRLAIWGERSQIEGEMGTYLGRYGSSSWGGEAKTTSRTWSKTHSTKYMQITGIPERPVADQDTGCSEGFGGVP